ncbi:MAG TPA: hypothetical protein VMJ10_11935 [Kofleriaceae bacterium]|nr:hypothetical protein [Kofleriaceae bacterium]
MRAGVCGVLLVMTAGVAQAGPDAEPNPEAEQLFRDGRALLKDGKISEACDKFAASSKLGPSVGTFLNLGDCRAKLGQTATAWAAFVEAGRLAGQQGDRRKAEADRRAGELEPELSYVTVTVDAPAPGLAIKRDGKPLAPEAWGQPIAIDPGPHAIAASAPGYESWTAKVAIRPGGDRADVRVPALHRIPVVLAPTRAQPSRTHDSLRTWAYVVGGAGLVAAGTGIAFLVDARSLMNDARKTCPSGQPCSDLGAVSLSDRASSRATVATVAGAAGAAALAASVVLWFVGRPSDRLALHADRDSLSLSLGGTF